MTQGTQEKKLLKDEMRFHYGIKIKLLFIAPGENWNRVHLSKLNKAPKPRAEL